MALYGLIGKKLTHSFSQQYFTEKFNKSGLPHHYQLFEIEDISEILTIIKKYSDLVGFNVTIPFKEKIIPYLNFLDENAQRIGAVNTVKILRSNGKILLYGFNTDAYGFRQSIKPFLTNKHHHALIFGTGGASKAVAYVLKGLGIGVNFVSQKKSENDTIFTYEQINEPMLKHHLLLVNATPVGMFPNINNCLPIPFQYLTNQHLVVDLIYNPAETLLLKKANQAGAVTLNGLNMLYAQAEKSWEIWNN